MENELRQFSRHCSAFDDITAYLHGLDISVKVDNISSNGMGIICSRQLSINQQDILVDIFAGMIQDRPIVSINCRITYDIGLLVENESFTGQTRRIIGLEFMHLNSSQQKSL